MNVNILIIIESLYHDIIDIVRYPVIPTLSRQWQECRAVKKIILQVNHPETLAAAQKLKNVCSVFKMGLKRGHLDPVKSFQTQQKHQNPTLSTDI